MAYILTLLLLVPFAGFLATLGLGSTQRNARWTALAFSVATTILGTLLLLGFLTTWMDGVLGPRPIPSALGPTIAYRESYPWVPSLGMSYVLGVDGLSVPLVFLTPLLTTLAIVFSWEKDHRPREFFSILLFLEFSLTGVFIALDFFLLFVFWELVLIPMFFLIGVWGGPNRQYASMKFLIYTHVGSVIMLLSILALYWTASADLNPAGTHTFDMTMFLREVALRKDYLPMAVQVPIFIAFFFAFGVKLPMVPFHTWLPDAHVEAPTAGSVLLAGILLKMGGYGLFRIGFGILPAAAADLWWVLAIFGVVSMIYAAFVCLAQVDLKRLIAYSSVGHMGFVLLGASTLTTIGIMGGILQMFAHGLITAVLFMLAGTIKHAAHTRDIPDLRGLSKQMPMFSMVLMVSFFASLGLPGLASFWGEFMVFIGTYGGPTYAPFRAFVIVPLVSIAVTASYYVWTLHKVVFGEPNDRLGPLRDLNDQEQLSYVVLLGLIVFVGLFPYPIVVVLQPYAAYLSTLLGVA